MNIQLLQGIANMITERRAPSSILAIESPSSAFASGNYQISTSSSTLTGPFLSLPEGLALPNIPELKECFNAACPFSFEFLTLEGRSEIRSGTITVTHLNSGLRINSAV